MNWNNKSLLAKTGNLILVIFGSLIIFASLGRLHWSADVLATFLDYLLLLFVALLALLLWQKERRSALIGLLILSWGTIDLLRISSAPLYPAEPENLRLMVFNLYYANTDVNAVMAEISQHDPDLIYLMEYPSASNPTMRLDLEDDYPFQLIEPSRRTMGTAIYSKHPFVASEVHQFAQTRIPISEVTIEIEIDNSGTPFTFVGGHPWPPLPPWGQLHREQLQDVIDVAAAVDPSQTPLIVAGDFNTSPQSYMLANMAQSAQVEQVRQRFDLSKTFALFPPISVPLDHVLVSENIHVHGYFFGDTAGSDHKPVIVDFSIEP